jgi:signal transduction histidine kinase
LFEVTDTGIGIHASQIGKLFQPFSQIDSSVTRRFDGTGLGLALSRQLCLALGGDIDVESTPGQGSTFRVRLPVSDIPNLISATTTDS